MRAVREHDKEVLIILAREHGVATTDAPGKECHAFVLHRGAVEGENAEVQEVLVSMSCGRMVRPL
jgi:hypothetical protein